MIKKVCLVVLSLSFALICAMPALAQETQDVVPLAIALEPAGDNYIVGHRAVATVTTEDVTGIRWKSDAPKIASISNNGAILFKKPGVVTISASSRGAIKATGSVTITVLDNRCETPTSRVYLKGNFIYADVLFTNESEKQLKKLGKTTILLTDAEGTQSFVAKSGVAKKAIKPAQADFITFKLMKADKTKIDLTHTFAAIQP